MPCNWRFTATIAVQLKEPFIVICDSMKLHLGTLGFRS